MKLLNIINIKTLFFSCLFVITFLGVKLQANHHHEQPYRSYDYSPEDQNYQHQDEYYYQNGYRQGPVYRNREDYPLVGAGVSSQGVGVNVGGIGVGFGRNY